MFSLDNVDSRLVIYFVKMVSILTLRHRFKQINTLRSVAHLTNICKIKSQLPRSFLRSRGSTLSERYHSSHLKGRNDIGIKGIMITISSIFSIKDISFVSSQQESSRYDILQAGNQRWGNFLVKNICVHLSTLHFMLLA